MIHGATFWAILPSNIFLSNVALALSNWEWVTNFYLDILEWSWALSYLDARWRQHCSKSCPVYHSFGNTMIKQFFVLFVFLRIVHPKKKRLKMYSSSGHPKCRWVSNFTGTELEKFSVTSLAHQLILFSEWVPSEREFKQLINTSQIIHMTPVHQ